MGFRKRTSSVAARILVWTLAAVFFACGAFAEEADFLGEWRCVSFEVDGATYGAGERGFEAAFVFGEGGAAELTLNGEAEALAWRVEGGAPVITDGAGVDSPFEALGGALFLTDGAARLRFLRAGDPSFEGESGGIRLTLTGAGGGAESGVYFGELEGGAPHGEGRFAYDDGRVYEGGWKGGLPDGVGAMTWPYGGGYDGEWEAGRYHGRGTFVWASGETYDGDWVGGVREGQGAFAWPSGERYVGGFRVNQLSGYGTLYGADGEIEQRGEWRDGALAAARVDAAADFVPSGAITYEQEFDYAGLWRMTQYEYEGVAYVGERMPTQRSFLFSYYDNAVMTTNGESKNIRCAIQGGAIVADTGSGLYRFLPDGDKLVVIDRGFKITFERDPSGSVFAPPWGNAKRLRGKGVIVSVFVELSGHAWSDAEVAEANEKLRLACEFLGDQGKAYGQDVELVYDFLANPDLRYDLRFDGEIFEEPPEDRPLTDKERADSSATYARLARYIEENIPSAELAERYGTDSVAFVFHVNKRARSYAHPYRAGGSRYTELAVVFNDTPAVYAHELLHLYGAADFYREDEEFYVGAEAVSYMRANFPEDIMVTNDNRGGAIENEITRLTALGLGWIDDAPELRLFPELKSNIPGAFTPHADELYYRDGDYTYSVRDGGAVISEYRVRFERPAELAIPETLGGFPVTGVGPYAFGKYPDLRSVTLPSGMAFYEENPFRDCPNLARIEVAPGNPSLTAIDGVLYGDGGRTLLAHPAGKAGEFAVPKGVTAIADYALNGCAGLTGIALQGGLTDIGYRALYGCSGLSRVDLPDGLKRIGRQAFLACDSLTGIVVPASVTEIGDRAFEPFAVLAAPAGSYAETYAKDKGLGCVSDPSSLSERAEGYDVLLARGEAIREGGDFERILSHFDAAIALYPDAAVLHAHRAFGLLGLSRVEEAAAAIEDALRLDPLCAEAYGVRSYLLWATGDPEGALRAIERAMELEPDNRDYLALYLVFAEEGGR